MGLDITACDRIELVQASETYVESREALDTYYLNNEPVFKLQTDGMANGHYRIPDGAETHRFRAGSYSGYNQWRELFSRAALRETADVVWRWPVRNPDLIATFHAFRLVHFSDCEGFIGPRSSALLAQVFAENFDRFKDVVHANVVLDGEAGVLREAWDVERYQHWQKAFELASRGGVVMFR